MSETILIVDDNKELREELRECLSGYQVLEASDGVAALELLRKAHEIDLVILDVRMPRLGGIDVLTEIKKEDPNLRIIIMTGYSDKDTAIEALKGRADDYIEKPVDPDDLRKLIEKNLEKKGSSGEIDTASIDGKLEKVKRFIGRNCFKKAGLEAAAKTVCLSPKYLSRIFKERTGESYVEYRMKVKNEAAQAFLKEGNLNVSQIAYKLGYETPESFIRQFKRFTGKTPTGYRKSVLKQKPAARKAAPKKKTGKRAK